MSLGDDHGLDHGLAAGKQERAATWFVELPHLF